jgi:hypothetical protein
MAPGIVSDITIHSESAPNGSTNGLHKGKAFPAPLRPSGKLDEFQWEDATPVIGREYPTVNIVDDLINASNADELLRDLAITSKLRNKFGSRDLILMAFTVSQRDVVFFRAQVSIYLATL